MNNQIAKDCLKAEITALQGIPYFELTNLIQKPQSKWVDGSDGNKYQLEIQAFWDGSQRGGNLRIAVSVDDGGLRALVPLTESFIVSPPGTLL
jgi:hypothetical protein